MFMMNPEMVSKLFSWVPLAIPANLSNLRGGLGNYSLSVRSTGNNMNFLLASEWEVGQSCGNEPFTWDPMGSDAISRLMVSELS